MSNAISVVSFSKDVLPLFRSNDIEANEFMWSAFE